MEIFFQCKASTEKHIELHYDLDWCQEDVLGMTERFFQQFSFIKPIEKLKGADLEAVRIFWLEHYYTLNFECYGQSIWIDSAEENSAEHLSKLNQKMFPL